MVYSINSFVSSSSMRAGVEKVAKESEEEGNIDLNLSLSLNGKFGVDPQRNGTVSGSSSHPKVSVSPHKRISPDFDENGAESKMWQSLDSQASNSSSFRSQAIEGPNKYTGHHRYPANIGCSNGAQTVVSKVIPAATADQVKGRVFNSADMPYVFTIVHGQKIEGFLSRYNEEGNISIICACHGGSMSPSEFIKHAGGGEMANPFRHIKMNYAVGGWRRGQSA